jgi:metallo-beta-lactamase class B
MKNILLVIAVFLCCQVFAQDTSKRIRINDDLEIVQVSRNAYIHMSWVTMQPYGRFNCNGLIYINNGEAVFMDTPMNDSVSNVLLDWFEEKFPGVKIKGIIVNHFHDDCLGGLRAFHARGIPSYANSMTNESIKSDSIEKPKNTFEGAQVLPVGKGSVVNKYYGEAHSPDNIVSYIPGEGILFGGCMIKSLNSGRGNLSDANLKQWSETVRKVKRAFPNAYIIIPGHGEPGGRALLDYTIKLFARDAQ